MKTLSVLLAAAGFVVSQSASADIALAKAKNCMSCHALANKLVGPAFKDVAKRYAGQPDAEDKLVQKVLKGGSGSWGVVAMPANSQVTEAEARTLVHWILSQK
ncbi:MAG: c-type cytochrome [Herbaspirillum sp.]|nr:c-type cytochrome [Herbaspirillum sp.]